MKKSTWKEFKHMALNHKTQFLGAINSRTNEEIGIIIDTKINDIEENFDRTGNIHSKHIEFVYPDGSSRLDCKGKVYIHNGCYVIEDWNHMVYRFNI